MTNIVTDLPHKTRVIDNLWIPMSDGVKLSARVWMPEDAEDNPVPALLEYIPYRKNDFTALRDSIRQPYLAGHGYACVRVDMRGSGDSDGVLLDEYLEQEQDDAVEVIAWLAEQSWCDGHVGMFGKSWGGFNSLQVAARRPPALKAIIAFCATDDRYATDVHYIGGAVLASDMLPWATYMLNRNAMPPDPRVVGDRWRDMWMERLENMVPFSEAWLSHQRRDDYWKHGSVCEKFDDIQCPVYIITGWADCYLAPVFNLLEGLSVPRKGLIGPWAHEYPTVAKPGPAIGCMQEMVRWWDHWLKGDESTGIMEEPMLRLWAQESAPPQHEYDYRPGRWIAEPSYPPPPDHVRPSKLYLDEFRLSSDTGSPDALSIVGDNTHGMYAGAFLGFGDPGELPTDQRQDDGKALTFTSERLEQDTDIVGFPEFTVVLSADKPNALIAVRLCDVSPTGESTLVSYGVLNLTHRESHEHPTPLQPHEQYTVTVQLHPVAHTIKAGHRWRLAISPTFFPIAWTSPEAVGLMIYTGEATYLTLPVRPRRDAEDNSLPEFEPPEHTPYLTHEVIKSNPNQRTVEHDVITGKTTLTDTHYSSDRIRLTDDGLEFETNCIDTYSIQQGDPLTATSTCEHSSAFKRGEWDIRIQTQATLTGDLTHFHLTNQVDAYEGEVRVFTRTWSKSILREFV